MTAGVLTALRDVVPIRPLTPAEGLSIAERQAMRFLELVGVTEPPVPEQVISQLPRVEVHRLTPWPTSGATDWVSGRWVIVLNGAESIHEQRYSLAHELKHIADDRFIDVLYRSIPIDRRRGWVEQVCDYFAGCLLVPRPWLMKAWATETQALDRLAQHFHVSVTTMATRLGETGLTPPAPKCGSLHRAFALPTDRATGIAAHENQLRMIPGD